MIISELETKRLKLIPIGNRHITKEYVCWMNDKDVIRFLDSGGDYDLKKLENYIKNAVRLRTLFWAIHIKNSKKHIGNIKIDPIDKKNNYINRINPKKTSKNAPDPTKYIFESLEVLTFSFLFAIISNAASALLIKSGKSGILLAID